MYIELTSPWEKDMTNSSDVSIALPHAHREWTRDGIWGHIAAVLQPFLPSHFFAMSGWLANCTMAAWTQVFMCVMKEGQQRSLKQPKLCYNNFLPFLSWLVWIVRKQGNVHIMEISIA